MNSFLKTKKIASYNKHIILNIHDTDSNRQKQTILIERKQKNGNTQNSAKSIIFH